MILNIIYEQKKKEEIRKQEIEDIFFEKNLSKNKENIKKNIDISQNYFGDDYGYDLLEDDKCKKREESDIKILPLEMIAILFISILMIIYIIITLF